MELIAHGLYFASPAFSSVLRLMLVTPMTGSVSSVFLTDRANFLGHKAHYVFIDCQNIGDSSIPALVDGVTSKPVYFPSPAALDWGNRLNDN